MKRTPSPAKLAKCLTDLHRELGSWRAVAEAYNSPVIKPGTLNRIANEHGAYMPADEKILIALGMKTPPKEKPAVVVEPWQKIIKKHIAGMARDTRHPENYKGE